MTALTLGFFDGVHLGHQALLKKLRAHPHTTILTFSNHPQSLLKPPAPELLIPYEERIALLREYADELIVLPFTHALAQTSYEDLLGQFSLSHLLLGEGAVFGNKREGNEPNVRRYAQQKGFTVEYFPKILFEGEPISSSRIRQALRFGKLTLAQQLLGRND